MLAQLKYREWSFYLWLISPMALPVSSLDPSVALVCVCCVGGSAFFRSGSLGGLNVRALCQLS